MRQQDRDRLEERIVAYFEGTLNDDASRALLQEVAAEPESRALFESHASLQQLISSARVPLETPIEAKRSIVERIPGLVAVLPGLIGGAQAIPITAQHRVTRINTLNQRANKTACRITISHTEKGPRPFTTALDEARFNHQFEVPRHARLRLAQNIGEIGHGKLALGKQRQNPDPRILAGRPQRAHKRLKRHRK